MTDQSENLIIKNKKEFFLFPKQVVSGDIKNFEKIKDDLIDWIYKFKENNSGISKISNRGGWQSKSKSVFTDDGFRKFSDDSVPSISELVKSY